MVKMCAVAVITVVDLVSVCCNVAIAGASCPQCFVRIHEQLHGPQSDYWTWHLRSATSTRLHELHYAGLVAKVTHDC